MWKGLRERGVGGGGKGARKGGRVGACMCETARGRTGERVRDRFQLVDRVGIVETVHRFARSWVAAEERLDGGIVPHICVAREPD